MKKTLLVVLLIAISGCSSKDDFGEDSCEKVGYDAAIIMKLRNTNISVDTLLQGGKDHKAFTAMVKDAYTVPRTSPDDFSNRWIIACHDGHYPK